jgi:predicted unusual protein kinase regulating ubiquinone biosynthesis (AarF/ABC1/UbiB family)
MVVKMQRPGVRAKKVRSDTACCTNMVPHGRLCKSGGGLANPQDVVDAFEAGMSWADYNAEARSMEQFHLRALHHVYIPSRFGSWYGAHPSND